MDQVRQVLNQIYSLAGQLRQSEENNRQMLQQLAQKEQMAVQQLNQLQQMCQQAIHSTSNVQNQNFGYSPNQFAQQSSGFGTGFETSSSLSAGVNIGNAQNFAQGSLSTQAPLIDPTTMNPDTYQNSMRQFHGQGSVGSQSFSMGQATGGINVNTPSLGTSAPFASVATMGPSTYEASTRRLGGPNMSLSNIGQQAGISNTNLS